MRVAIQQPNFIPWCGYFAKMRVCDAFIFLDNVACQRGTYVNRAMIRDYVGSHWLSLPMSREGGNLINQVRLIQSKWNRDYLKTLQMNYKKCAHFDEVYSLIAPIFINPDEMLALFNIRLIKVLADYLKISCNFVISSDLAPDGNGDERLISLVKKMGADTYISGKGGQNYQDPMKFKNHGILLEVREYKPIPYRQIHGDFVPGLSILDALFNLGTKAINLLCYPD